MGQLLLNLAPPPLPDFGNFVPGANAQAVSALRDAAGTATGQALYVWGAPGSGRSHLLSAALTRARQEGRPAVSLAEIAQPDDVPQRAVVAADDVEALENAPQQTLFHLFNLTRERALTLVCSGAEPPLRLPLREDLRTRLGSALVFRLLPLSDAEKRTALQAEAHRRNMPVAPELLDYLINHQRRDMPSLMCMLAALDELSLARKRLPTLPLLRELLASHELPSS